VNHALSSAADLATGRGDRIRSRTRGWSGMRSACADPAPRRC